MTLATALGISAEIVDAGIRFVALGKLDSNPWQTRINDDSEHVQKIADDIKARAVADLSDPQHGLLQVPIARPHPTEPDRFQLAFGHTRLSAFRHLANSEPNGEAWEFFPINVRVLSDRDMAEMAARENAARKDLTAIETAKAMQRLITDFGLTQLDAGKIFGYSSQGAVSNLLRLLELPEKVQDLVHSGQLPERNARALIPVARVMPGLVEKAVATKGILEADGNFDYALARVIDANVEVKRMHQAAWQKGWKPAERDIPLSTLREMSDKGIANIPACETCDWHLQSNGSPVCTRPICWKIKTRLYALRELKRVSKELGIAIGEPGETVEVIWNGQYDSRAQTLGRRALASKHESLRLIPLEEKGSAYGFAENLGKSDMVGLATVDLAALKKSLPREEDLTPKEGDYEAQRRVEDRERKRKHEACLTMLQGASVALAKCMPDKPTFLALLFKSVESHYPEMSSAKFRQTFEAADALEQRRLLMFTLLCYGGELGWNPNPTKTRARILEIAEGLQIKLPAGWDELPTEPAKPKTKRKSTKEGNG